MPKRAYVDVNSDGFWTLYAGDGSEDEPEVLAVGDPFEPGTSILDVMDGLQAWATENDYVIMQPAYSQGDANLDDLFSE